MVQSIITDGGINAIATMISMHVAPTNLYINRVAIGSLHSDKDGTATALESQITVGGATIKTATSTLESGHVGKLVASFTPTSEDTVVGEAGAFTVSGVLAARVTDSKSYVLQVGRTMNINIMFGYSR